MDMNEREVFLFRNNRISRVKTEIVFCSLALFPRCSTKLEKKSAKHFSPQSRASNLEVTLSIETFRDWDSNTKSQTILASKNNTETIVEMASSSIVRLGPNEGNLSAELLRNAVTLFFRKTDDKGESDSSFVVRNKYFNANVVLKGTEDQKETAADVKEDGIILVFDAVRSNPDGSDEGGGASFDSLQAAHQKALCNNDCGDLLRLCVGVSLSELSPEEIRGKDHEKEYSRRILWCLDNGYEYIEADLSEEGQQKGHGDRDKDGFARIVEAIEGTVWSSAAMSTTKSTQLKDSLAETKQKVEELKSSMANDEESSENPYIPPDPSLMKMPELKVKEVTKRKPGETTDSAAAIFGLKDEKNGMDAEDVDADKLFSQMESVLKEAQQIRKEGHNLSDEERRERAGNAALALVNLMGQFGLDDDDDSEGYGSDDSMVADS